MLLLAAFAAAALLTQAPSTLAAPQPPLWPVAFTVNATEGYAGKGSSHVSYYYDSMRKAEKWVRETTGLHAQDNVCQGVDAPCTDLVVGGYRWIIHPVTSECCLLWVVGCVVQQGRGANSHGASTLIANSGTFDEGCGPLVRNWIQASNGTFKGSTVIGGRAAEEWDVQGFSLNRYWSSADGANEPLKLDQGGYVSRDRTQTLPRDETYSSSHPSLRSTLYTRGRSMSTTQPHTS